MEAVATRQSHFGIRKLTIGAASVLLGTTLWLGTNANVTHAEDENANGGGDGMLIRRKKTIRARRKSVIRRKLWSTQRQIMITGII